MRIKGTFEKNKTNFYTITWGTERKFVRVGASIHPRTQLAEYRCSSQLSPVIETYHAADMCRDRWSSRAVRIKISGAQLPHVYMLSLGVFFDQNILIILGAIIITSV